MRQGGTIETPPLVFRGFDDRHKRSDPPALNEALITMLDQYHLVYNRRDSCRLDNEDISKAPMTNLIVPHGKDRKAEEEPEVPPDRHGA